MTDLEKIRVHLLRSGPENNLLHCITKDTPRNEITVKYERQQPETAMSPVQWKCSGKGLN